MEWGRGGDEKEWWSGGEVEMKRSGGDEAEGWNGGGSR